MNKNETNLSIRKIAQKVGKSASTVCRVLQRIKVKRAVQKNPQCRIEGRPRKITKEQGRRIIRSVHRLGRTEGNFTVRRLMQDVGISEKTINILTVQRFLNKKGYYYLQARKKGLVTKSDRKIRISFASKMKNGYDRSVWERDIAFYLDGVNFAYKRNPLDQARAPTGRIYRKKSEGLDQFCTAKGKKVGTGGRVVKLIVAISYDCGVILCEQYEHMNGEFFSNFVEKHFEQLFKNSHKETRLWIQDGDPTQNSGIAQKAMKRVNAQLLKIPPRSPDKNPI